MGKRRQWLELAEIGLLFSTFITVVWSLFGGIWQTPLVFLWGALCLNTFNRLHFQRWQRRQTLGAVKSLDNKLTPQVQQLAFQVQQSNNIKVNIAELSTKEEIQDYLGSLEKSLTHVVQYLNEEALDERLKNIEQTLLILREEGKLGQVQGEISPEMATPNPSPAIALTDPWGETAQGQRERTPPQQHPSTPKQAWQCIQVLDAHQDCVSALDFSDDQRFLASGSWDQQLKIWQVRDGKLLSQVRAHQQGLLNLKFLGGFMDRLLDGLLDGDTQPYAIASSSFEPDVKLWHFNAELPDRPELTLNQSFREHQGSVYALTTTPEGVLLTASHDQTIRCWQPKDGRLLATGQDYDDQIQAIACGGSVCITGGKEGVLKFWRAGDLTPIGSLGNDQPESIAAISIRGDGELFISGGESGTLYLWQLDLHDLDALPETVPCFTLPAHDKAITKAFFCHHGQYLITASVDGVIKIWQLGLVEPLATLHLNDSPQSHARLLSLAMSADGSLLAAGSSDGKIKVWMQQSLEY